MLQRLGNAVLANKFQAIFATSLMTMVGLLVPFFTYIGSGLVPGLVCLSKNAVTGLQVIIGSFILTMLFVTVANVTPYVVIAFAIGIWAPVWISSNVLRITASQGSLLLTAAIIGMIYILLTHLLVEDIVAWWQGWLNLWLEQIANTANREKLSELFNMAAPLMNAMTVAGLFVSLVCTVFCARWWQAYLVNKGGFRKEFQSISLPRYLLYPVLAIIAWMIINESKPGDIVVDILVLLIFVYLFQGLASIHRVVAEKHMSGMWLTGMYIFMFLIPQILLFIACIGMIDSWLYRPAVKNSNP